MIIATGSTALGIVLFLCLYLGFRTGLRLGMAAARGIPPEPVKSPIKAVMAIKDDMEQTKAEAEEARELAKMFSYDGDIPKG